MSWRLTVGSGWIAVRCRGVRLLVTWRIKEEARDVLGTDLKTGDVRKSND